MDINKKLEELKNKKVELIKHGNQLQQQLQETVNETFKTDGKIELLIEEKGKELEKKNDPIKGLETKPEQKTVVLPQEPKKL